MKRVILSAAIAIIVALAFVSGVYVNTLLQTRHSPTSTSNCLISVPWATWVADQTINSSFVGFVERFPNGTASVLPAGTCPQLVPANLYSVVSGVETNSNFTKAENGSRYFFFDLTNSSTSGVSNSSGPYSLAWTNLYFYDWSHVHENVFPCGYDYFSISEIVVIVPVNSQGYHLSNATVSNPKIFDMNACQGAAR